MTINCQRGMGLVEVLVALGLTGVIGFVLITMIGNMNKSVTSLKKSGEAISSYGAIVTLLQNKEACAPGLGNPKVNAWSQAFSINEIKLGTESVFKVNTEVNQLIARKLTLEKLDGPFNMAVNLNPGGPPNIVTYKRFLSKLTIVIDKASGVQEQEMGGNSMRPKTFFFTATVDQGGTMIECYGGSSTDFLQDLCEQQMGGVYDASKYPSCLLKRLSLANSFPERDAGLPALPDPTDTNFFVQGRAKIKGNSKNEPNKFTALGVFEGHTTGAASGDVVNVESDGQARLLLAGRGDTIATAPGFATYASLNLNRLGAADGTQWFIAHKANGEPGIVPESLTIGRRQLLSGSNLYYQTFRPDGRVGFGTEKKGSIPDVGISMQVSSEVQASLLLKGEGEADPNASYSALYLGMDGNNVEDESWVLAFKKGPPVKGFQIGKWYGPGLLRVPFEISAAGKVTIRQSPEQSTALEVNGNATVNGDISVNGTVTSTSDERLKKEFTSIPRALAKILKLEGVYFHWRESKRSEQRQIGFKAQNVEKVFPEVVVTDERGFKAVAYDKLVAPVVEALRDLATQLLQVFAKIEDHQLEIDEMKKENIELKRALCEINAKFNWCFLRNSEVGEFKK